MPRYRRIRKRRGTSWTSESSARANKARWEADRQKRDTEASERIREMMIAEIENFPRHPGDAIGCLQWHDYSTGKVRRWVFRRGDRLGRVTMEDMKGKRTESHGWTWFMDHLRGYLAGTKV